MSIYDEIDPLAYAELYQSIYPDWKGKQELLDLIGNTQEIKPKVKPQPVPISEPTEIIKPDPGIVLEGEVCDPEDKVEDYIDFTPEERVPVKYDNEAKLLGYFCSTVLDRLHTCESKGREWELITEEYNQGSLVPELYALKGKRTERALRIWLGRYEQSKQDMYALLHGNRYQKRHARSPSWKEGAAGDLLHPTGSASAALSSS